MCSRFATRGRAVARAHIARRSIITAASARSTVGVGASASTRRAIVPASHMRCRLTTIVRAVVLTASCRRAVGTCSRLATRRAAVRAHVARRSVVVTTSARPTVGIGASASTRRPVIVAREMRVPAILGPTAPTTRTTAYVSAPRSSRWSIVMAGYIPRTTMPKPTTVS